MQDLPDYIKRFADFRIYEATYQTEHKDEMILLESRTTPHGDKLFFTIVDNKQIRTQSIYELVNSLPSAISLTIPHSVRILWNGEVKGAKLLEIFKPSSDSEHIWHDTLRLKLVVDNNNNNNNNTYETETCDTLQDALMELEEITKQEAKWWLCICYECEYSGHARNYNVSERDYWCYRDAPEAAEEIQANKKFSTEKVRLSGMYYVDAFHTCAAWEPTSI